MGVIGPLLTYIGNLASFIFDSLLFYFVGSIGLIIIGASSDSFALAFILLLVYLVVRIISHNRQLSNVVYSVGYGVALFSWLIGAVANYHGACGALVEIGLGGGNAMVPCSFSVYLSLNGLYLMILLGVPVVVYLMRKAWRWSLARRGRQ